MISQASYAPTTWGRDTVYAHSVTVSEVLEMIEDLVRHDIAHAAACKAA